MIDPAELAAHVVTLSQKFDALAQTVHELQLENHTLRSCLSPGLGASSSPPEPKISVPDPFSGDRKKFPEFISSCNLLFDLNAKTYHTEKIKVGTTVSYLRGEPRAWANSLMEKK